MGLFDVIGPIMVGPSSSHTAGAVRLGNFARLLFGGEPNLVELGLHGSFAATGEGHGTHLALLAGAMGLSPADERIPGAKGLAAARGLNHVITRVDLGEVHPNSARIRLSGPAGGPPPLEIAGSSIGGGQVRIWRLDGFPVALGGVYPTLLLLYPDRPGMVAEVSQTLARHGLNIAEMKVDRTTRGGEALMTIALDEDPGAPTGEEIRDLPGIQRVWIMPKLE